MSNQQHITLIVTGSIAAVKTYDLLQSLAERNIEASIILTDAALQWVTRKAARMMTEQNVMTIADITAQPGRLHQQLGRSDAILVAPSSADFIKQLRYQDSALSKAISKSGKPVIVAPAMNVMMWHHPATQRNSKALLDGGARFLGPVDGHMACGDTGYGRFMEPAIIAEAVAAQLARREHPAFAEVHTSLTANPALPGIHPALAARPQKKLLLILQEGKDVCTGYALVSCLRSHGYEVTCAASEQADELLPAEGLATISNHVTYTHHYQDDVQGMEHIRLPEAADLVLVAPASAKGMSDMLQGCARNFVGCLYLATKKPVVVVPSADPDFKPSDTDLERLKRDGVNILEIAPDLPLVGKPRAEAIVQALDALVGRPMSGTHSHAS